MQLSKPQFLGALGAALVVVVLAAWWFLGRPSGDGGANGTQIDHMTTDPQFANPNAGPTTMDSGGTLPGSNAP